QILQFPKSPRQVSSAIITKFTNDLPSECQLLHNQQTLNIIAVLDMPHQWQTGETITILHNHNRAIVTGCTTTPDNCFNLTVTISGTTTNLLSNEDATGKKATQIQFLCGATNIVIPNTPGSLIDYETFDNNGLWCLILLGFKFYVY
ncbi:MAG: hypothetical protein ACC707_17575, partial [Thiohalomonadales bacterium]